MNLKIDQIEVCYGKSFDGWFSIVWRDLYRAYFPRYSTSLTKATVARLYRAQLRLAGYPVTGWPFTIDYCECLYPIIGLYWGGASTNKCVDCGREVKK